LDSFERATYRDGTCNISNNPLGSTPAPVV
jgi:hypothetical protein